MKPIFKRYWISIEFVKQDFWIGVFWELKSEDYFNLRTKELIKNDLCIYICLIPCFPIKIIKAISGGRNV